MASEAPTDSGTHARGARNDQLDPDVLWSSDSYPFLQDLIVKEHGALAIKVGLQSASVCNELRPELAKEHDDILAAVFKDGKQIGGLCGVFIDRGGTGSHILWGEWSDAMGVEVPSFGEHLADFFDMDTGLLQGNMSRLVTTQGERGGYMHIVNAGIVQNQRGHDLGLDLLDVAIAAMADIKGVSLVTCALRQEALQQHLARIGFKRVAPSSEAFFLEPGLKGDRLSKSQAGAAAAQAPEKKRNARERADARVRQKMEWAKECLDDCLDFEDTRKAKRSRLREFQQELVCAAMSSSSESGDA
eukprot:TRINITY_DN51427_c0_g1_i1.p1 TRINITY_DN51427_c0_g1~~TRINITY_DN51427_c0_g1_i1.p1  ORF type:complete len:302 (-),score=46.42 TRINITY_DN51427_c0_g1_i1:67-972(-)